MDTYTTKEYIIFLTLIIMYFIHCLFYTIGWFIKGTLLLTMWGAIFALAGVEETWKKIIK